MGSLFEELDAREAASRARIEELRRRVAELTQAIEHEEATLSRLVITRETVTEILGPAPAEGAGAGDSSAQVGQESGAAAGSPIGVLTVRPWQAGISAAVLPRAYQDILEVFADHGAGMLRAGRVAAAVGLGSDKSKIEGLRSKLNKLAERGWLDLEGPGMFVLPPRVAGSVARSVGKPAH
ncbi:hypothetical protein [Streptomyces sp. NPDC088789]|uniref:hypothetical protein n=1 Tax=Streptomyces sp. NPDC088789 TaxID=3365899 RepID=UPI0037FF983D